MVMRFSGDGSVDGLTPLTGLEPGIIANNNFVSGSITQTLFAWNSKTVMFTANNTTSGINQFGSFTLTAAQAPIGSYVVMGIATWSGYSAGVQKIYLSQSSSSFTGVPAIGTWTDRLGTFGYWSDLERAIFPIPNAAARTFYVEHGTITSTHINDYREAYYLGYFMLTD